MPRSYRPLFRLTLLAAFTVLSGCYTYSPAALIEVAPPQNVRARLAPAEAERLTEYTRSDTRSVEGEMLETGADSVMLLVEVNNRLRGDRVETFHQRVRVARAGILDLEIKELDRPRTYMALGGTTLAVGILLWNKIVEGGGSIRPDGRPPPDDTRLPLVLLRIPFGG